MAHLAAVSGNVKVLEALLDEGANKNIANRWEETPLLQAIVSNNALSIKCLFDAGARLTLKDPAAALCTAAGNEDVLFVCARDSPLSPAALLPPAWFLQLTFGT